MSARAVLFWVTACVMTLLGAPAIGQGSDWDIDSFDVVVEVQPDSTLMVRETIVADFSREPHHGIYREIPYRYRRAGSSFDLRLRVDSVRDGSGLERPWAESRRDGRLRLRIGDAGSMFTGKQVYVIEYRAQRGLLSFDTHDELYWNATGTEWLVPIGRASCTVVLPNAVATGSIRAQSNVGAYGTSDPGPDASVSGQTVVFGAGRSLRPWEGLTVVVGWPPGTVEHPGWLAELKWFIADNGIVMLPFLTAPLLYLVWRLWGRDRGVAGSVMVRYDAPEGMSPLEVGTLIDERVDTRDVTAALVGLAVRGYLQIDASEAPSSGRVKARDVVLCKRRDIDTGVTDAERMLLNKIFTTGRTVRLSSLEHVFYAYMPRIAEKTHNALIRRGYFASGPRSVRSAWVALGVVWGIAWVLGMAALVKFGLLAPVPGAIAAVLAAPQVLILAPFMPRRTAKGRRALEAVRGLEEYIVRAEARELQERASKDGFQPHFESLLPYALALGLLERWAEKFEGLFTPDPSWYVGPAGHDLTPVFLASHLGRTTSSMGSALASMPRSEGGSGSSFGGGGSGFSSGFSGGGAGGGGGGAW